MCRQMVSMDRAYWGYMTQTCEYKQNYPRIFNWPSKFFSNPLSMLANSLFYVMAVSVDASRSKHSPIDTQHSHPDDTRRFPISSVCPSRGRCSRCNMIAAGVATISCKIKLLKDFSLYHWSEESATLADIILHLELHFPPLETRKRDIFNQWGTRNPK